MFLSQSHLPQILDAACYTSQRQHRAEIDGLLTDQWHFIGVTMEFPTEGTYRTTQLLDRPLITWRHGGSTKHF